MQGRAFTASGHPGQKAKKRKSSTVSSWFGLTRKERLNIFASGGLQKTEQGILN